MKPLESVRCPRCLKKDIYICANIKDNEDKYGYGKCQSCGWYGKLKNALRP